ncbi:ATP-binding protein [Nocardia asiatica]|uniref:ATP-binding protein n=1 Tax=Nocardia asiatica TaxID=209252 RepID=UPI003EE0BBA0
MLEALSRTTALTAAAAVPAGLPPALFTEYRTMVGYYHAEIAALIGELDDAAAGRLRDLTASRAWQQVSAMEEVMIHPAPAKPGAPPALPLSIADWRSAAEQVNSEVVALWGDQNMQARRQAADTAAGQARDSLLTGAAVSGAAVLAFLLSLWLANRLIGRLRRLRSETLALAEIRLPETIRRLSESEAVDPETDAARLEFGRDEIGQVAQAFNRAQVFVVGEVVADLVHLLAELVDNAVAFSPPESRVDVTGNLAGKGAVIEIGDQGMGMAEPDLRRANDMLARPPISVSPRCRRTPDSACSWSRGSAPGTASRYGAPSPTTAECAPSSCSRPR